MLSSYNRTQKKMSQSHNAGAEGSGTGPDSIRATSFDLTTTASPLIIRLLYLKETFLVITNEPQMNQCHATGAQFHLRPSERERRLSLLHCNHPPILVKCLSPSQETSVYTRYYPADFKMPLLGNPIAFNTKNNSIIDICY